MNLFDFNAKDRNGNDISLSQYKGNVILVVNSATQCGFTPQYAALQDLYDRYKDQEFVILDFPCNQFKNQAPGSDEDIKAFCDLNYGVTFPAFSKIEVNGDNTHPLYRYLKSQKEFKGLNMEHPIAPRLTEILAEIDPNYENTPDIKWNFTKFLIDKDGTVVERFEPTTELSEVEAKLKTLL